MTKMFTLKFILIAFLLSFASLFEARSQSGARDISFNPDNGFASSLPFGENTVSEIIRLPDGKFIVVDYSGFTYKLTRITTEGNVDSNFSTQVEGGVSDLLLQNDGRIILVGSFTKVNGVIRNGIARVMADGTLDTSFDPGSGIGGDSNFLTISSVVLQSDGKIIIAGEFLSYNGTSRNRIARINSNGSIDVTFNPGVGPDRYVSTLFLRKNGKILIGGAFNNYDNVGRKIVAQINSDGSLDNSFNAGTGTMDASIYEFAEQSDGKIIVAGAFNRWFGTSVIDIVRLTTNGSLDVTFASAFFGGGSLKDIQVQADDKILLAGSIYEYNGLGNSGIARYNADGTFDNSFKPFFATNASVYKILLDGDHLIIAGQFFSINATTRKAIARLNLDGSLDGGSGTDNAIYSVNTLPNDGLLIAGNFQWYDAFKNIRLAKIKANGDVDKTFSSGTGPNNVVYSTVVQPDGKILIGGDFTSYNGTIAINRIARLNATGELDATFSAGAGAEGGPVRAIVLLPDGRVAIAGQFTSYNGVARNGIAVLQSNGSLDTSFDPGAGVDGAINALGLNDSKLIIVGAFATYNTTSRARIARINLNGSLDTSFDPGTSANGTIYSIAIQSDGKILIGGSFTSYKDTAIKSIARINSDATVDASFNAGETATDAVRTISVKADGTIFIGGDFTSRASLLNSNGSVKEDWKLNPGPNASVYSSIFLTETIIITGAFNLYDSAEVGRIAKVFTNGKGNQTINFSALSSRKFGDVPFTLTAKLNSSLAITYSSSNTNVATIANGVVTIVGAGTTTITASQAGDSRYNAATSVTQDLVVNKAEQLITFTSIEDKSFNSIPFSLPISSTPSSAIITFSSSPEGIISISESRTVTILGVGKVTITASIPESANYSAAASVSKSFCIKPTKPVITASFTNPEVPILTSNVANGNQWYLGDQPITDGVNNTLTVSQKGLYKVKVSTAECGESEFSDTYSIIITGDLTDKAQSALVYPNPASDYVIVPNVRSDSKIQLLDLKGAVQSTDMTIQNQDAKLDVRKLPAGNYLISHQSQSKTIVMRFIKR